MSAAPIPQFTVELFEAGTIDVDAFDHDAHIYVAWLYLERHELLEAIQNFTAALKRLTTQLGIPGKYHETITWFFMVLIEERRKESSACDWYAFRRENDDLFARDEDSILNHYYKHGTLGSERARRSFLLPDRHTDQSS
jgi:hypothetical protein